MPIKLQRYRGNPILSPDASIPYESWGVLNPGAFELDGKVYLLYRAAGDAPDYTICLSLAVSENGFDFQRQRELNPVLMPTAGLYDGGCVEDARITEIEGTIYVTYACRPYPPGEYWTGKLQPAPADAPPEYAANRTVTALAKTSDFQTFEKLGKMVGGDVDDRDVILFPGRVARRYAIVRRPSTWHGPGTPFQKPSMWLSFSDDLLHWNDHRPLAGPVEEWEALKIGASTPPIETDHGWFFLYHGVGEDRVYRAGMMMLDRDQPERIIARYPYPILEPQDPWEREGVFPNVVFPTGHVLRDDTLLVYYGGGDKVCCVASASFSQLVDELMNHTR